MTTKTYNGYSNYETWAVSLWLDNEEGSQNMLYNLANNGGSIRLYEKAEVLKGTVLDNVPDLGASLFADLLNAALGEVNWQEIIETHIEEEEEEGADDGENCWSCGEPEEAYMGFLMCSQCKHTTCFDCQTENKHTCGMERVL